MRPFDYSPFGERIGPTLRAGAHGLDRAFGSGFRPPVRMKLSEWSESYRRFGDDAPLPGPWSNGVAPYLVEIMDRLTPDDPAPEVPIMKCSQSGGSAAGENLIGYVADVLNAPMMYVQATLPAAFDWARNKLWPMIRATPRLNPARRGAVREAGEGSTKGQIDFVRGGYLLLAGANSAASLTQKTVRIVIEDDLDQYPDDLDGQGSPEAMVDSRLKVFRKLGLSKRLKIGTPTVKGASKIAAAYEASDQRRAYLKCPACACRFDPVWQYTDGGTRDIHWPDGKPSEAYLVAPCCGAVVEEWQKVGMIRPDCWVPTVEIEGERPPRVLTEEEFATWRGRDTGGRNPGYWITGLITVFDTWGELARKFVAAQGDLNKLKGWVMLDLGEPFEVRGEAPDHDKLAKLVEQSFGVERRMPNGALASTVGVDVQGDGLYYTLVAWGPAAESWTLEAAFLPGATDVEGAGAWVTLDQVCRRGVVYPGGQELPIDQTCVDAGYHTGPAEAFCKGWPNRLAVFGRAGWTLPILGRGINLQYDRQGKNAGKASKKADDKAHLVGTFGVKSTIYGFLRETLKAVAAELAGQRAEIIRGRCHFGVGLPADYFEQVTAETVETTQVNGFTRRVWKPLKSRPNHYLDCRVYAHAAAEKLMLDTLTPEDWAALRAERYAEPKGQADLFGGGLQPAPSGKAAPATLVPATVAGSAPAATPAAEEAHDVRLDQAGDGWISTDRDWL